MHAMVSLTSIPHSNIDTLSNRAFEDRTKLLAFNYLDTIGSSNGFGQSHQAAIHKTKQNLRSHGV